MNDGYSYQEKLLQRLKEMELLVSEQTDITKNLKSIDDELSNIPNIPDNIDKWISSVENKFSLADFQKIINMNKNYNNLLEKKALNSSKIKVIIIENLLDQIKETLQDG